MMRHAIYLVISTCLGMTYSQIENVMDNVENTDLYLYVSDDQNNMRRVYNSETVDKNIVKIVGEGNNIVYYLHTRKNPHEAQILVYDDENSISVSNYDPIKVTVFLVHGWLGNRNSTINTVLTEAFLQDGDVNVIVVDWCQIACTHNYITAIASVPAVGRQVGMFVEWLVTFGALYEKIHLIGHSLGAHVCGNAGKETEAKVQRITGLDPAGPFWQALPFRLTNSNAQYVEVIHTNMNCLGYKEPCGDADFFPNGGYCMPGCSTSVCSHSKAYYYMAESMKKKNMYALPCQNVMDVISDSCDGEPYLMGTSDLSKNRSGLFRLDTDSDSQKNNECVELAQEKTMYRRYFARLPVEYACIW